MILLILCLLSLSGAVVHAQEWRVLALRVDFPLESPDEGTTTGVGAFDLRFAEDAGDDYMPPYDLPPHDRAYFARHLTALARYYQTVSDGRVVIESEVFPRVERLAYRLPQSMLHYGNGRTTEEIGAKWIELLRDAIEMALADPDGPQLSDFNSFLVFHAGVGHETGELNDIRSVFLEKSDFDRFNGGPLVLDGVEVGEAWILPESPSLNGRAGLNGLMAKFFGNQLGLPGLSNFADGLPAVGGWSLMDVGANALGFVLADSLEPVIGFTAPHPIAWSKARLGWIEPLVVRRDTVVSLLATDRAGDLPKALRVPIDVDEYFLLENRQQRGRRGAPEGQVVRGVDQDEVLWLEEGEIELEQGVWTGVEDYDAFIPGSGVLIWHIDDGVIEAHAADGAINNRPERQGIALEEADGYRDIGNPVFERLRQIEGSPDDPFFVGGQTLFGPGTRPDTRSNRGWDTGIEIEVLSDLGDTMQVAIRFAHSRPGWPLALAGDGLLQAADLDGDGADELLFEADAGIGYADAAGIAEWRLAASRLLAVGDGDGDGLAGIFSLGDEVAAWPLHADEPLWSTDLAWTPQDALFDANKRLGEGVHGPALLLAGPEQLNTFIADTGALWDQSSPTGFLASMKVQDGGSVEDVFVASADASFSPLDGPGLLPPAVGDLNGDGMLHAEVVLADSGGAVIVHLAGEPIELGDSLASAPVLGDLDGDGTLEIIFLARNGMIHALRADGVRHADFPFEIPRFAEVGDLHFEAILFDIDADGKQEIFAAGRSGIFGIDDDGKLLPGFPLLTASPPTASPVAFDINGDGRLELAALDGEALYVWDPQRVMAGYTGSSAHWPQARADAAGTRAVSVAVEPTVEPERALLPQAQVYCYPNPVGVGEEAHMRFALSEAAFVELDVFDVLGARVGRGHMNSFAVGAHEIAWSVDDYQNGLYICRLQARSTGGQRAEVMVKMAVSR